MSEKAVELLAWLIWCYQEGYTDPTDRAIITNWMGEPQPHPEDEKTRQALLTMAREILTVALSETTTEQETLDA